MAANLVADKQQVFQNTPGQGFGRGYAVGRKAVHRKIQLDLSTYATGGMPIKTEISKGNRIFDAYQMAGYDPWRNPIQRNGYQGILVRGNAAGGGVPKLMIYFNGAEMADNTSAAAGRYIWMVFLV